MFDQHRDRYKAKASAVQKRRHHVTEQAIGQQLNTRAACSCWMCGNPRKYFGLKTMAEKSFDQTAFFN